jgi:hypothetical protein
MAKVLHYFLQNMWWDQFWAIFSQIHLVTLIERENGIDKLSLRP